MINSIDLSRLKNGEYAQFLQNILEIVRNNDAAALQVVPQYDALYNIAADIEKLFKVPTGSAITLELEELDRLRDNALYGVISIVRAFTFSENTELKKHADLLSTHIALFGSNITQDSYQSETASIRNILADWDSKPELGAAAEALQLKPWRNSLEEANKAFDKRYLARAEEMGTATADTLKEKRMLANEAFYNLRNRLNSYYEINEGAEPYHKTVSVLNGLLTNYNDLLARRTGAGNAEPEAEAKPLTNAE